jgi:dihydroorotate dehydrogenase electron transfer subunit
MMYEKLDCIDAGTDYCPCHLAETGDCILCSQLSGKTFCDCINWKGVCIYQEFVWNGNKAKPGRKNYICKVIDKSLINKNVVVFTILTSHKLAQDLLHPGSFIFMRSPESNQFYDAPISVMDVNLEENTIKVAIEVKGIKTKSLSNLKENDSVSIRAPFWNGIIGLKNIYKSKDGVSLLIARGIGMAPMIPVLKKLYSNGNKTIVILDKSNIKDVFIKDYLNECNSMVVECRTLEYGELSEDLKETILDIVSKEDINLIHCDGPDILNYKMMSMVFDEGIDSLKNRAFSCCNNAKMCCGEGVCGTCSNRYKGHVVKKLCKVQIDPKYVFEGRRLI